MTQITIQQAEDFAEIVGGYQDDFGKWIFPESDYLCRFADIILAAQKSEISNLNAMVQILKTDLAAAELELKNLRSR